MNLFMRAIQFRPLVWSNGVMVFEVLKHAKSSSVKKNQTYRGGFEEHLNGGGGELISFAWFKGSLPMNSGVDHREE